MRSKILFVDDDPAFLRAVEFALADDFDLHSCVSFNDAKSALNEKRFDLMVLDWDLGQHSAEDLLDQRPSTTPVLIITGKADKNMAIRLLNRRIHGMLEKPVTSKSLQSKIQELLSANQGSSPQGQPITDLDIIYYRQSRRVLFQSEEISLTPIENKILETLLDNKNQVLKRSDLTTAIWGTTNHAKNVLDTHLYNLKKKIPTLDKCLKTVYGDGLVLNI